MHPPLQPSPFCHQCRAPLGPHTITNTCVPCQKIEGSFRSNPQNFQGKRWKWTQTYYAPIQMVYGTIQTHYLDQSAQKAWSRFQKATGLSRRQLKHQGYRVKRITLLPDWKAKDNSP